MLNIPEYTCQGSGTPVVMLHSSMSSKEQWLKLSSKLNQDYHTIAIDLYGYGGCCYPQDPSSFTLADEVLRIDDIVTKLIHKERFHLVGHSYGGATALRFAYANSERVASLSLYEPVAFHLLAKEDPALAIVSQLADDISAYINQSKYSLATEMFVDFWSGKGTYSSLNELKRSFLDDFIRKVTLDFLAGINEPLTTKEYQQIQIPTCLVRGTQSPLPTQQIADNLEATLPQMQTHQVDGGHMAPISHADIVNGIWETFIRSKPCA
ncbi:MAG: pimeloyl-ACP methyl ester carboxylesterase [Desulforhopalus sp.]|jgi:pimeloyl-ACP methyl ester carboxylesterase